MVRPKKPSLVAASVGKEAVGRGEAPRDVSIEPALDLHGDPIELDGDVGLAKTHGGALL